MSSATLMYCLTKITLQTFDLVHKPFNADYRDKKTIFNIINIKNGITECIIK